MVFEIPIAIYFKICFTSGVTMDEESILRTRQLDLIYAQYGILYEIIPNVSRYNTNFAKPNPGPHADMHLGD